MIIGLTGGMGCGKSTAAKHLEARGFVRIDADQQVKGDILLRPEVRDRLRQQLGDEIVGADGAVDRARMGALMFADDEVRRGVEALIHPLVYAGWRTALRDRPDADFVLEVPLLFEQQLENWFDFTVCVSTSADAQLVRLEKRGVPRQDAVARISKQMPLARKAELADHVLTNDGSLEFLHAQVERLIAQLR